MNLMAQPEARSACADLDRILSPDFDWVGRKVFSDDSIYRAEQRRIFARSWAYLAHESQLRNAGDFVSAYIGEVPVIVARSNDGQIVASVNSCSHRGLRVCRADQGNTTRFVCPYHTWTFRVTGELIGAPQAGKLEGPFDKARLGLKRVPCVDTAFGMIFGSLDPEIEPLDTYLGDHRFYLEAFFDRFPGGLEVVGGVHKWQIACNWKLPVENMLGDIGHAPFLHGALVQPTSDAAKEIEQYAVTAVTRPGHAAAFRLMPDGTSPEEIANLDSTTPPELRDYLVEAQRTMAERLSPLQARLKGMAFGVYPNLSVLWGQSTLRVTHPRAPGKIEYWSWWLSPIEAPAHIREMLRAKYNVGFGPGGFIEQEDSYAWARQFEGSSIGFLDDTPYFYGLGLGEECEDPQLPGMIGKCYNEHYARSFYKRWHADMTGMQEK